MAANYPADANLNHPRSGHHRLRHLWPPSLPQRVGLRRLRARTSRPVPARASTGSRLRSPCNRPLVTCWGRCCSPMRAFSTSAVPVSPGITHCRTVSCRWALASSGGVSPAGVVPPSTGASPACMSRSPRAREYAVAAKARPVTAALATVAPATPRWVARRLLLPATSTAPPATCAAIPARFTGVQRAQPALATRSRWPGWSTTAAAPLSPTAPISEPPNQVARPRSCNERARVLSWVTPTASFACLVPYHYHSTCSPPGGRWALPQLRWCRSTLLAASRLHVQLAPPGSVPGDPGQGGLAAQAGMEEVQGADLAGAE